jgi:hypothetical protein
MHLSHASTAAAHQVQTQKQMKKGMHVRAFHNACSMDTGLGIMQCMHVVVALVYDNLVAITQCIQVAKNPLKS